MPPPRRGVRNAAARGPPLRRQARLRRRRRSPAARARPGRCAKAHGLPGPTQRHARAHCPAPRGGGFGGPPRSRSDEIAVATAMSASRDCKAAVGVSADNSIYSNPSHGLRAHSLRSFHSSVRSSLPPVTRRWPGRTPGLAGPKTQSSDQRGDGLRPASSPCRTGDDSDRRRRAGGGAVRPRVPPAEVHLCRSVSSVPRHRLGSSVTRIRRPRPSCGGCCGGRAEAVRRAYSHASGP